MKKQTSILALLLLSISIFTVNNLYARNEIVGLCYHQVEPKASGRFSLSCKKFKEQLNYLKNAGYKSLNSDELIKILQKDLPFPEKAVLITFDDGYKTVFDYAFPIMKELGFKGIICIYPQFIGSKKAMSWREMKQLQLHGWSVESHSWTHSNLSKMYAKAPEVEMRFLHKEIVDSKKKIENKLGTKVKFMVWPYGVYTDRALKLAKEAGYYGAFTVDGGGNHKNISPFQIKRQVIYSNDSLKKFLLRFGMAGLELSERFPAPGQVIEKLATFSCKIPGLQNYSKETHVLNAKITRARSSFTFDPATQTLSGKVLSKLKSGNYFVDIYLREKKTGITQQNGWLFSIKGNKHKTSY
jgi:peptidoglycan/xylan/chitin deacetylase (PgdA/CDA1 family)